MPRKKNYYVLQYQEQTAEPQYFLVTWAGKKDSTNFSDLEELIQVANRGGLNVKFEVPNTVLAKVRKNFLPPQYITPVENKK